MALSQWEKKVLWAHPFLWKTHHCPQKLKIRCLDLYSFEETSSSLCSSILSLDFSGELSLQGNKPGHVRVQILCSVSSNFEVLALPAETAGKVGSGFIREGLSPLEIKWTIAVALLIGLRQVAVQQRHSLLQAGWQGCTPGHTASFWAPWQRRLWQRESWGGNMSVAGESGMRDLTNMCSPGPENLLSQAMHFSSYSFFYFFFICGRSHSN